LKICKRSSVNQQKPVTLQEDETMGLCFKKELTLSEVQLFPPTQAQQAQPTRQEEKG
jgi:hypothetical protein